MIEACLVMMAIMLGLSLLLLLVERVAPVERGQPMHRLLFNLLYGPGIYAFAFVMAVALSPASLFLARQAGGGLLPVFGGAGSAVAAQILFALAFGFVWDFIQYWLHRLEHGIPFLWETHRFHHEEKAVNVACYARSHVLSVLTFAVFNLPLALLFGARMPHAIAIWLMFVLWGLVTHANLRFGFGPLTPLVVGPQLHRIHHSILPEHRDRNFAMLFPIIDIAFGTYYRPRPDEYPPTGVDGECVSNLRGATVQPFIAWWRMFGARRGARRPAPLIRGHST
jgi:sterol desaturase/sphingolipid hydroxylase (fatty acid hydroxylase superfamily)